MWGGGSEDGCVGVRLWQMWWCVGGSDVKCGSANIIITQSIKVEHTITHYIIIEYYITHQQTSRIKA